MDKYASKNRLIKGNERYVTEKTGDSGASPEKRQYLAENGQHPYALIVGCSDSRVPPEVIFDCGPGELFIIRTAGNVLDDVGLGSVEYGAEHLHIPLIVVLGHEDCGAVKATVGGGEVHGCIKSIVEKIAVSHKKVSSAENVQCACEDENVRNTVAQISDNPVIAELIHSGKTFVIGAKASIRSGVVTFFE